MYILITLIILSIVFIWISYSDWSYHNDSETLFLILGVFSTIVVILFIAAIWISNTSVDREVQKRIIEKNLIEEARRNHNLKDERVQLLQKVIEYNQRLSDDKYDQNTQWKWWTPKEFAELEPIK